MIGAWTAFGAPPRYQCQEYDNPSVMPLMP